MTYKELLLINFIYKHTHKMDFIPPNILNYEETPEYKVTLIKADKYILTALYKHDIDCVLVGLSIVYNMNDIEIKSKYLLKII